MNFVIIGIDKATKAMYNICSLNVTFHIFYSNGMILIVTMKDVARTANVSLGTVSNVLNGSHTVLEANQKKYWKPANNWATVQTALPVRLKPAGQKILVLSCRTFVILSSRRWRWEPKTPPRKTATQSFYATPHVPGKRKRSISTSCLSRVWMA